MCTHFSRHAVDNDSADEGDTDLPQGKCSGIKQTSAVHVKTHGEFLKASGQVKSHRLGIEPRLSEDLSNGDKERAEVINDTKYTQCGATKVEGMHKQPGPSCSKHC